MSFTSHAELDMEPDHQYGDTISIGTERRGNQTMLVFDGPGGLETVIRFTEAEVGRNQVTFYSRGRGRTGERQQTGGIEAAPEVVRFLFEAVEESEDLDYEIVAGGPKHER